MISVKDLEKLTNAILTIKNFCDEEMDCKYCPFGTCVGICSFSKGLTPSDWHVIPRIVDAFKGDEEGDIN